MTDYPAFLAARLNDCEMRIRSARSVSEWGSVYTSGEMLADIAAKRAIIARYEKFKTMVDRFDFASMELNANAASQNVRMLSVVIKDLCRPFADHPDYPGGGQR